MLIKKLRMIYKLIALLVIAICTILLIFNLSSGIVYADSDRIIADELNYDGSTYHFNSELVIDFFNDNGVKTKDSDSMFGTNFYTNATSMRVAWTVSKNNFPSFNDMKISGDIILSDEDDNSILSLDVPSKASGFGSDKYESVNLSEGKYYFVWQITFNRLGKDHIFAGWYTINVIHTAPTGELKNVEDKGYTNSDVYFVCESSSSVDIFLDGEKYKSNDIISEEGNHTIKLNDYLGNTREYFFTIDKTAPIITSEISNNGKTNKLVAVTASDKNFQSLYYKFPGASSWIETTSEAFQLTANNGTWEFKAYDKAGNESDIYKIVYDDIAPKAIAPAEFNCSDFIFSANDSHGVTIEYWLDGNTKNTHKGNSVTVKGVYENIGLWHFVAYDDLGNRTQEYISKLYIRDSFGNSEKIKNGYKVPSYYKVKLSNVIYEGSEGTYSFSSYQDALNFAISKEWQHRVVVLASGWSYLSISNESASVHYEDRKQLDEAVEKYAKRNISERQIFSITNSANVYPNPTDENMITREDALTLQNLTLPSHLSQYNGLPVYFIAHDFSFIKSEQGVSGNIVSATIRFVSNGIHAIEKTSIAINYSEKIESILTSNNNYDQGYYLIEERDLCGNEEHYLVYLDTEVPTLKADIEKGNGAKDTIEFSPNFVEQNKGVMLYTKFNVSTFIDIDECVMIEIDGRGMQNARYVVGTDSIPSLCFSNGYWGVYTISVYDRSRNILTFDIKISGELPALSHTSLTNETRCTFTLSCSDSSNAITQIELFKVTYTGEYVPMTMDDNGTVISAQTLSYVLRTGGKYVVRFKDIYDRVVESEPIFYMKGLPSGVLSGVKENGITNKDVRFDYASNCSLVLYTWKNSQWVVSNEFMGIEEKEGYNIATISASAITSNMYKYFLYVTEDPNLFVEYRFEIDCIAPQVEVKTQEKNIEFETITNIPFFVTWEESNLTAYYYNKNSSLGELGQAKYTKDMYISIAGTYVFAVYDSVKNVTTFTITLDNAVTYSLDGAYTRLEDGSYISKNYLTLTVNERTAQWSCVSTNDFIPSNGQRIDIDGTYVFHIEDLYQNTLDITLIIDNLPPTSRFEDENGVIIANSETNQFFRMVCDEENVTITFSSNGLSYVAYEGQLIEEEGSYTFKLSDRMNNIATVSIKLDLSVAYSIKGTYIRIDDRYVSKNWLSVTADEAYTLFDVENDDGLIVRSGEKISIEGIYVITIRDNAGNVEEIIIEIDKTAPTVTILTADGQAVERNSKISATFRVICDEEGSTVFIAGKDLNYAVYDNESRTEQGIYNFRVVDRIGNEDIFSIEIDRSVEYYVRGIYVQSDKNTYVSKNLLVLEIKETYKSFGVMSDNGHTFMPGDRVELEGTYIMEIEDNQGNIVEIVFVIDKTAPTIRLEGVEANNTTKNDVNIFVEGSASNYYTRAGESGRVAFDGGITISASGNYTVVATDLVGNETTLTFKIDKEISATATPNIVKGQIISESISFKFDEALNSISLVKDGAELQYRAGKISEPGHYVLTAEDNVGNIQEWDWTIISNIAQSYQINIPDNYKVSILLDDSIISDAIVDGQIHLERNGAYTLYFENIYDSGLDYSVIVVLDNVAPKVDIDVGKSSVTISNPNKDNLSFVLYKDGNKIDFSLGKTLTSAGEYKLVVTDEIGNVSEYEFELQYVNAFGIIVIVIVCVVVLAVIIMVILSRRNQCIK